MDSIPPIEKFLKYRKRSKVSIFKKEKGFGQLAEPYDITHYPYELSEDHEDEETEDKVLQPLLLDYYQKHPILGSQLDIKVLDLSDQGLSDEDIPLLSEKFPLLRELNLSANKIGNLKNDLEFLEGSQLESLDLSYNMIISCKHAACGTLIDVNLSHNPLKSLDGFHRCKVLEKIDISMTNVITLEPIAACTNPWIKTIIAEGAPKFGKGKELEELVKLGNFILLRTLVLRGSGVHAAPSMVQDTRYDDDGKHQFTGSVYTYQVVSSIPQITSLDGRTIDAEAKVSALEWSSRPVTHRLALSTREKLSYIDRRSIAISEALERVKFDIIE
ncbi:hypothetical protein ADUPG1_013157 [Aduncisulcus paluster]|uniref:Uncharacterized protein n=1 Tax=Aduncisulcus paluster TaxID=2918883 RepID=A0ABQ5K2I1_9EUKA|nr:hypothetical protein ADUPG1_013157 [Aduncisulcus paluster]